MPPLVVLSEVRHFKSLLGSLEKGANCVTNSGSKNLIAGTLHLELTSLFYILHTGIYIGKIKNFKQVDINIHNNCYITPVIKIKFNNHQNVDTTPQR